MPDFIQQLWEKAVDFWTGLSQRNQIIFVSILGFTGIIISVLMYFTFQPQWVPLYNRDLAPEETARITSELDNMGVAYRTQEGVVEVPLAKVDSLRRQMAEAEVLPETTVGFEIFEKGGIGITNFERQMRFKRALQGSLERSIRTNPKVQDVSIDLALPQDEALFKEDKEPVTASVNLKLKPYSELEQKSVEGIVNLVSYGVVGLEEENIVVMDQHNRTLNDSQSDDSTGNRQAQQQQVKKNIEDRLERKVQQSLGRVLTRDRLAVAVTVEMDFDRVEKKLTQYRQPEGAFEQLMKKQKEESRQLQGKDVQPGGEAGSESNIPGYEMEDEAVTQYDENKNVVEYYADKNVKNIVKDPAISRVSTVVSVDGKYTFEMDEESGEIVENYKEPTEEEMEAIRNMARAAVGFSDERGDQIEVAHLKFDRSEEIRKELEERRRAEFRRRVIYFASIALGITFFVSGLLLLWHRRRKKQAEQEVAPGPEEEPELPTRDVMAEVSVEEQEEERKTQEVRETVDENPETAAQVLRSWFAEEI